MQFIRRLVGWFFTYPPYRDLTAEQSAAVVALLTLALYADGAPRDDEREELEREVTGVPHYWANEVELRRIIATFGERVGAEDFGDLVSEVVPALEDVPKEFLLTGAAFVCHGDEELTPVEQERLAEMGRAFGLADDMIERIVSDPVKASEAMFAATA
jgi:hypothetical protein